MTTARAHSLQRSFAFALSMLASFIAFDCAQESTNASVPMQLTFTVQPSNAPIGSTISPAVRVAIVDAAGNVVTAATTSISLAIGTSGTLSGTTTISAVGASRLLRT